jgi:hypothetical protein
MLKTLIQKLFLIVCFFVLSLVLRAQEHRSLDVPKISDKITIDGVLDENRYQKAPQVSDFWQYFPKDSIKSQHKTEVWFSYDDKFLYVAARCYTTGKKYVIPSLRRDYRAGGNDNISFMFDTFNDNTNALLFGINPLGVLREATISGGGQSPDPQYFSVAWDNKWQGESKVYDNYWTTEIAIPFTTLRFKQGAVRWNFNCYRFDTQTNEQSTWMRIPQNQVIFNLAFMGQMHFEKPLAKGGSNISIIPYVYAGSLNDFEKPERSVGQRFTAGFDAKIGITTGLNLDLTANPDFSNVEADRIVTNLSRFDISYPEQRQFFLENADLFSNLGSLTNPFWDGQGTNLSPFFSRQIGIAYDASTGTFVQNTINYGARVSGKMGDNWRLGAMTLGTGQDQTRGISDANYSVAILQRKLFSRSNITVFGVNKETFNPQISPDILMPYNRVAGVEYNLQSADNRWTGKAFYHRAFTPQKFAMGYNPEQYVHSSFINYNTYRFGVGFEHQYVGRDFVSEVGFVPRTDFFRFAPSGILNFYPNGKTFNRHTISFGYDQINSNKNPAIPASRYELTDRVVGGFWEGIFQSTSRLSLTAYNYYTYLFDDFDPTLSKNTALSAGTDYNYTIFSMIYLSDQRNKLAQRLVLTGGQYFDGSIWGVSGAAAYRFQPYGQFILNYTYNRIETSKGIGNLWLIGPRVDVTFSKGLFWTTVAQYNSQFNNINLNSRVQWRYAPVSDLFIVYTDNYYASDVFNDQRAVINPSFSSKNRAIILKMTYWLNL